MGTFSSWLVGQTLKITTDKIVRTFFNDDLIKRLFAVAEKWQQALPEEQSLLSIDALLVHSDASQLEVPPPVLEDIYAKLERDELPTASDWTAALVRQWKWISSTSPEPQKFFLIDEYIATDRLRELSEALATECQKNRELFQIACLARLDNNRASVEEMTQQIQQTQSTLAVAVAGIQVLERRLALFEDPAKNSRSSGFNEMIDTAVEFTKRAIPDLAIEQLNSIRKKHWEQLTDRERFRLIANLGHAYSDKEHFDEAGRHFIECRAYQRDEEQARCLEAVGYAMVGDRAQAFELSKDIVKDFPQCDLAYATVVRNAPAGMSLDSVLAAIPPFMQRAVETSSALVTKAMSDGRLNEAEEYARSALTHDVGNRHLKEHLAQTLTEIGRLEASTQRAEHPRLQSEQKVKEALEIFNGIFEELSTAAVEERARQRFQIGICLRLLGKTDEANEQFRVAYETVKTNIQFARQYAILLVAQKADDAAIDVLTPFVAQDETGQSLVLLVELLAARNRGDDKETALTYCKPRLESIAKLAPNVRIEIAKNAVQLLCDQGQGEEAKQCIDNFGSNEFSEETISWLRAIRLRRLGNRDEAIGQLRAAAQEFGTNTDKQIEKRVAFELTALGQCDDAFTIWKRVVEPTYYSVDTPLLLHCAVKCGESRFIAEFCKRLRENGIFDRAAFHLEINILNEFNCFQRVADAITSYLSKPSDTGLAKELRVRLSHQALITGQRNLVDFNPENLPSVEDVEPEFGLAIVDILCRGPNPIDGVDFAYRMLRMHFDSHWAHKAMVMAFLGSRRNELKLPEYEKVAPGCAVKYKAINASDKGWIIVEDEPNPSLARNEYAPDHGLVKELLGKVKGERFFLRNDSQQVREAKIVDVWSKYKLRFNLCMEEWDKSFREHIFIWKFEVKKRAKGKEAFKELFKSVEQKIQETQRREDIYRNNPASVTNFAVMTDSTVLEALQHLYENPTLPIRCCVGDKNEYRNAESVLDSNSALVLDGSALATLFITGGYKHLSGLDRKLVVSEGTLREWRKRSLEKLDSPSEGGFLTKVDGEFRFIVESKESLNARMGEIEAFIETISSIAMVEEGLPLSDIPIGDRETFLEILGRPAAESIAIAKVKGFGLWTDDLSVAAFGGSHVAGKRVWTSIVFEHATGNGKIPLSVTCDLLLKLLHGGYIYTRILPEVAEEIARKAEWKVENADLESVLKWLANPNTIPKGIYDVAERLLPNAVRGTTDFRANLFLEAVIKSILKRRGGYRIVDALSSRLDVMCGVDVVAFQKLLEFFYAWKQARQ